MMSDANIDTPTLPLVENTDCQDAFTGMIHDIRNRIGAMKLGMYLMEKQSPQELQERIHSIQEQINSLNELVQELKALSPCEKR